MSFVADMEDSTPVVIGVGDFVNRSLRLEDAQEPSELILNAITSALRDTGLPESGFSKLASQIDSISVVRTWTWPYTDLPGLLASKLGACPGYREYSEHGGNHPGRMFDDAARRLAQGHCKLALVAGGEALASLNAFAKARKLPPPGWTKVEESPESVFSPTTREISQGNPHGLIGEQWAADHAGGLGALHGIGAPIHVYPLFENAFRAHRGQSISENDRESAEMYYDFARIAEQNEYAWNYRRCVAHPDAIKNVTKNNRMICFPYPLLMNAFNTVNLAAACILTTTKFAREIGVPEAKWIYARGGAGTKDSVDFWNRPNFHSSPAISRSIDAALHVSALDKNEIDMYDFYSCFPIVPKLACTHLRLSVGRPGKPISLLGGLTSFGGAGNNYSMHALTAMTRELRKGTANNGLVLANGGVITYQYAICLSRNPPKQHYPQSNPLSQLPIESQIVIDEIAEGEAIVETYTVEFGRDGQPSRGHIVGRLKRNNHRFLANHGDQTTLQQLASFTTEPIGRTGQVRPDSRKKGQNVFQFSQFSKL